jgi:hypothetical protein
LLILNPSLDDGLAEALQPCADLGGDVVGFFQIDCAFRRDLFASGVERSNDVLAGVARVQTDFGLKSGWRSEVDASFGGHVIYSVSSLLMHPDTVGLRVCQHLHALFYKLFLGCTICAFCIVVQSRCSSILHRPASMAGGYPKGYPPLMRRCRSKWVAAVQALKLLHRDALRCRFR